MTLISSLLAATDFSVDGNNAVRRAALLAHQHGARLHILHVLKPEGCSRLREWFAPTTDLDLKGAQARAALRRVAFEIAAAYDVAATIEVVAGDPLAVLADAAGKVDLVVLGRRGHGRREAARLGRTADRMARTCARPVLVVRQSVEAPYRQVLAPVDFSPFSEAALRCAAFLAGEAPVHVFHAIEFPGEALLHRGEPEVAADARLRRTAARLGLAGSRLSFSSTRGAADLATLDRARSLGADLIVAGKHGGATVAGFLLGGVSGRLLRSAGSDVLIVPRPRGEARPAATGALAPWTRNSPRFLPRRSS